MQQQERGREQNETLISWISSDIDFKNEDDMLIFDKNKFYKWINISEKKNLLERLFS